MIANLWDALLKDTAWWHNAYIYDWATTVFLFILARAIKTLPVFERDFSITDPIISFPKKEDQVPHILNQYISALFPLTLTAALGIINGSSHESHHALLAGWSGITLAHLITDALKNRFGLGFLFLFLAARTGVFNFSSPSPTARFLPRSRFFRLILTVCPLFLAAWVAITRVEDHKHHKEDIIVGSLIGFGCANLSWAIYWPHPFFSSANAAAGNANGPRNVYETSLSDTVQAAEEYELANAQDDEESVLFDTNSQPGRVGAGRGGRGNNGGRNRGRR